MPNNSTPVITSLNKAWAAIQRNHPGALNEPGVPNVMIVTGRRRHKSEGTIRGQHCSDTWHLDGDDKRVAEVWISGERLAEGGAEVMQTLLHEAAHALAHARGIKDTSNKNRYHNGKFVTLAVELGLEGPDSSGGPALGYSNCTITKDTTEKYDYEIKQLDDACKNFVAPSMSSLFPKVRRMQAKAFCECPEGDNEIPWTKRLQRKYEATSLLPLLCAVCRQAFVPEDDPEK